MVEGYFCDLNCFWRCRKNFGGTAKKTHMCVVDCESEVHG